MTSGRRGRRPSRRRRGAAGGSRGALAAALAHHGASLGASIERLARHPLGSGLTVLVLAIALALPTGLYVLLRNVEDASRSWQQVGDLSLFLHRDVPLAEARRTARELAGEASIAAVRLITPQEALAELRAQDGFAAALEALDENPLPAVIVVTPRPGLAEPALAKLREDLAALPRVERSQFDMDWLIRFNALLDTGRRLVQFVAALLVLGVMLIVGNTIRLEIENRRAEIEITKMLGATDGFIRRPFLYSGLWLGLLGGVLALAIVRLAVLLLGEPVSRLAQAYDVSRGLAGPGAEASLTLLGAAALLGWLGAWIAVTRHLQRAEPGQQQ